MQITKGIVQDIPFIATPNHGGALRPDTIVIHDTAGQIDETSSISWLCNPAAKASAHFVISRSGVITQLASCLVQTWHAGASVYKGRSGANKFSIGIELVNPGKLVAAPGEATEAWFGKRFSVADYGCRELKTPQHGNGWWMPYTENQLDAAMELVLLLARTYGITEIVGHWGVSPGRKVDPNPIFPLAYFRSRMMGRQDDVLYVKPRNAIFRRWPSFNKANRVTVTLPASNENAFEVLRSGEYYPVGDEMPEELTRSNVAGHEKQLWYCVRTAAGELWVWDKDIEDGTA